MLRVESRRGHRSVEVMGPVGAAVSMPVAGGFSVAGRVGLPARGAVPWRSVAGAVLLSLLLGVGVVRGLVGHHPSGMPAEPSGEVSREGLSALPLTAQAQISGALGGDSSTYSVHVAGSGLQAVGPAQHLRMRFDRSDVRVDVGPARLSLNLRAVGYGSTLTALGDVTPHGSVNRVVYAHAGVSEWYANGPLGLEQGFTIPRALSEHPAGPLTLSMTLSGNMRLSLATGGQSLTLSHKGMSSLRYDGLVASDARGRTLHSWLMLEGRRVLLRVDTRGAHYPLRIDPLLQQGAKLTATEEKTEGELGNGVALSANGNIALIGGGGDNSSKGAAWVFTRSGTKWTQQAKLTGSGETGAGHFGAGVALSSEGNTALIGGYKDNTNKGAAWVFTRSGTTWTQQGSKLTASGSGEFGLSVALSAEGNIALIGGRTGVGAAWVFTRSGTKWTEQAKLTGGEETGEGEFGSVVALSSEGNTALIGGPSDNSKVGAAWVFTRSGTKWTQQGSKLTASGESGKGQFGSVALSSDGNTALIGSPAENSIEGSAWMFTRSEGKWTQTGSKLTGSGEKGGGYFGGTIALASNGYTALITGTLDNEGEGAAWLFTRSGSTWTQQGSKITGSEELYNKFGDDFGTSVALSSNGGTAVVGGSTDHSKIGAAWMFVSAEELAHTFRPKFYFDTSEPWRPLNVEDFLSEENASKEPRNSVCNGEGTCYPLTGPAALNKTRTSKSFIDIAGDYKTEGKSSYHSAHSECVTGSLLDCNSGPYSAFYYHIEGPHEGYTYIDYWIFYRFNFYSETLPEEVAGNHEGDWESVTIAPSKQATTFDFASFSQHGTWYSYLRHVMSCEGENRGAHEEVHESGSCGSEKEPKGLRVSVFPAYGDHANYPEECEELCGETGNPIPERAHDGSEPWGNNEDSEALLKLPETGTEAWVDWPGVWGNESQASPELPPMSPGTRNLISPNPGLANVSWENIQGNVRLPRR